MAKKFKNHYAALDGRSAEDRALERFAEMVIQKIESIQSDWKKPWFTENTLSWPKNLSGRKYNGMNALMLYLQCENEKYKIPVFMTFDQVRGLNYKGPAKEGKRLTDEEGQPLSEVSVLKGAKSFPVFLTIFNVLHTETRQRIKIEDYRNLSKDEQKEYTVYPNMQVYNVFNVAQTNIQQARPELYAKLMAENVALPPELSADGYCFPAMDEMVRNNEWLCPIRLQHQDNAYYSISRDEIVIPEKEQFYDAESFYGTELHEMIHSTGAKQRLDRFSPISYFGSPEYSKEELVAELGSALVMQEHGLCKTIKEDSCAYLKSWLEELKESPTFIKSILLDVKRATAMVNDRINLINSRLLENGTVGKMAEPLPMTGIPDGAVSEFHMLDNESRDAVYNFLHGNLYDKDTGNLIDVSKPVDRVVRVDKCYFDHALECVYDNLDSETLSKIVNCGDYFKGHLIDNYSSVLNQQFTEEFELKRNDPNWLREQGIVGDVKWDLRFFSTDGYHLVKAITENQCRIGVMDHHCSIFRPFVEVGEKFGIEDDLGYMTELRRRLLSKDEKVDPLGRITFTAPPYQYADTGNVRRDILIDGEAKAVFVLEKDSDVYDLNFVLELKDSELLKSYADYGNIIYDKESGIYYTMVSSLYDLFQEKDRFYPIRVITDKVNMSLKEYLNLPESHKSVSVDSVSEKDETISDRGKVDTVKDKEEVHLGLYAFQSNGELWGLQDGQGRVVIPPHWHTFEKPKEKEEVIFRSFIYADGMRNSDSILILQRNVLADLAGKLPRLSNVRIEERGEHHERWIAADIDGKPVVSEKITDLDWVQFQEGVASELSLANTYFADYLSLPKQEQERTGIRM